MTLNVSTITTSRLSKGTLILIFILCPLLPIAEIIKRSIQGKYYAQICFCIFLGLLSVLAWPPRGDVYRHAMTFFQMQGLDFGAMMTRYFRGGDVILLWLQYFGGKFGLHFEIIRFIFIFTAYWTALKLYTEIITHFNYDTKSTKYIFWIIVLSVPFVTITYGLRYGLSSVLTCYFIIKRYIFNLHNTSDYLFLIVAFFIHFGILWLIALAIIAPLLPNKISKLPLAILFIVLYGISTHAADLIRVLPLDLYGERMINAYTIGEWATKNYSHNFIGSIPDYFRTANLWIYIILSFILIPYNNHTKIWFFLILIWSFCSNLYAISGRINIQILIMGGIIIFYFIGRTKFIISFLSLYCIVIAALNWRSYTISNIEYIITPLPIALFQSYDYQWLRNNIYPDGTLKIYNRL